MQKYDKRKSFFMFLRGRTMFAPTMRVVEGIDTYAKRVCRRRRDRVTPTPTRYSPSTTNRQNKRYAFYPVGALTLSTPAPLFFSGRADNACTNLLGFFVRYVRTRGIVEIVGSGKTADFRSALCGTHLPRMVRATNSCTREELSKRGEKPS